MRTTEAAHHGRLVNVASNAAANANAAIGGPAWLATARMLLDALFVDSRAWDAIDRELAERDAEERAA